MSNSESLFAYRLLIESALVYAGGTHTFEDVVAAEIAGDVQVWLGPNSVVVTEIDVKPSQRILHMFLAAGNQVELKAMEPGIIAWGKENGCTKASLIGRKGWDRSFLQDTGWSNSGLIIMEKDI